MALVGQVVVAGSTEALAGRELERALVLADSWVREFVVVKQRGLSGRVPKDSTLANYVRTLNVARDLGLPDLRTCTLEDLNAFLDRFRTAPCKLSRSQKRTHSLTYYSNMVTVLKLALKFHKRKDLDAEIKAPKRPEAETRIKEQLIPEDHVRLLIEKAPTLRDRVLVQVFDELGNRRGEMWNLRIKDVQFDEYSAILTLTGKTGTRRRRIYNSVPDLRAWLNNHPYRNDPHAPLFLNRYTRGFTRPAGIYYVIRRLGEQILGYRIRTHQFRHTKATKDSRLFTDREMMKLYGWSRPDMVSVYSHLSMRDVDEKDLALHGLKPREEVLRPLIHVQRCSKCNEENAPVAVYCSKCGELLPNARPEELKRINQEHEELKQKFAKLEGQFEKAFEKKITDAA